jgi:hypothetical protein
MNITTEQRLGPKGAWNEGKVVRGDRDIMVDGVRWGHVEMKGHGQHGNSFEFHDLDGDPIFKIDARTGKPRTSGRHYIETAWGSTRRTRRDGDTRTTEQMIIAKALQLIEAGRLIHPDEVAALKAKEAAENQAWLDDRNQQKDLMRDALKACWARTDLSNSEREGLALAWLEIFHGKIDE